MHLTPAQLIEIQADALFTSDADGRLRGIREPGYPEDELDPAPRFFWGRTLKGGLWRFRHDVPEHMMWAVEQLCRSEPPPQRLADEPQHAAAIRALLSEYLPIAKDERGPAYWIPEGVAASGKAVLIAEENAQLLEAHFPWKIASRSSFNVGPLAATVVEGSAVAICLCARITAQAAEAGVETAEPFRGHGYASAAVACWAAAIRQRGLLPLYSTSWDNLASQGVARRLGMVLYADDWSIT